MWRRCQGDRLGPPSGSSSTGGEEGWQAPLVANRKMPLFLVKQEVVIPQVKQLYWNIFFWGKAYIHFPGERLCAFGTFSKGSWTQGRFNSIRASPSWLPTTQTVTSSHSFLWHFLSSLCSADIFPPLCGLGQVTKLLWSESPWFVNEDNDPTHLIGLFWTWNKYRTCLEQKLKHSNCYISMLVIIIFTNVICCTSGGAQRISARMSGSLISGSPKCCPFLRSASSRGKPILAAKNWEKKLAKELNHSSFPDRGIPVAAMLSTEPGAPKGTGLLHRGGWGALFLSSDLPVAYWPSGKGTGSPARFIMPTHCPLLVIKQHTVLERRLCHHPCRTLAPWKEPNVPKGTQLERIHHWAVPQVETFSLKGMEAGDGRCAFNPVSASWETRWLEEVGSPTGNGLRERQGSRSVLNPALATQMFEAGCKRAKREKARN